MTAKRKRDTLKALERAAMRWYRGVDYYTAPLPAEQALQRACAAHAKAKRGEGK